jgi:hypothetical protein
MLINIVATTTQMLQIHTSKMEDTTTTTIATGNTKTNITTISTMIRMVKVVTSKVNVVEVILRRIPRLSATSQ